MNNDSILRGYTSQQTAYEVKDYPYGYTLRTSIFYWIESKPKHGDRLCTYTINPKTGKPNKPKYGTYYTYLYLYLDSETGHVKTGGIDAYNKEYFQMRFGFLINKIGERYISDVQQENIRRNYAAHMAGNVPYEKVKYSEAMQPVFMQWAKDTYKYIRTCPFSELVDHPEPPAQDNPDGKFEYKMASVECPAEPVKDKTHNITVESVTTLLHKTLPNFRIAVSENSGWSDLYLKIVIAPGEGWRQAVSLSLNLKTLLLQTQGYGGEGGQAIYRDIDPDNPKEKWLAMKNEQVTFRTPQPNEKDVLRAIELFAINYRKTLIQFVDVLKYRDEIDFKALLNLKQTA